MSDGQMSFASITGTFLKRNYGKGSVAIRNIQNLKAKFYTHLKDSDETPSGDGYFIPVNVEGNESGGAGNESQGFNDPQTVSDVQFRINAKHTFWPFELTGFSMEVAISNADSFARSLKRQQTDNTKRFMSDLNRQYWGTGTGIMAFCEGIVTNTVIPVSSVQYFRTGQFIDIWSALGGSKLYSKVRIQSISVPNKTITLNQTITTVDQAIIVKQTILDNAPTDYKEVFGASALVDTTTFNTSIQGVSKTQYPVLQSTVIDLGGAAVTNSFLQSLETGVENASEEEIVEKWSDRFQRDKYLELLTPLKRFMNNDAMDSGMQKPLEHNGKPWYVDKDCPANTIFAFSDRSIEKFVIMEPDIVDKDGAIIRALPGADVFQGYYKSHLNAGSLIPNAHGKAINCGA